MWTDRKVAWPFDALLLRYVVFSLGLAKQGSRCTSGPQASTIHIRAAELIPGPRFETTSKNSDTSEGSPIRTRESIFPSKFPRTTHLAGKNPRHPSLIDPLQVRQHCWLGLPFQANRFFFVSDLTISNVTDCVSRAGGGARSASATYVPVVSVSRDSH